MLIRVIDIVISLSILAIFTPVLLVLILLIIVLEGLPVFYKQDRVGQNFINFRLVKFRTMTNDSDKVGLITIGERDPRVTSIGYYLRKYKFDELPQLWNVLIGDMSLVGARPEVEKYVNIYKKEYSFLLSRKPGLTSEASCTFSNENALLAQQENPNIFYEQVLLKKKIKMDLEMIKQFNVLTYFRVLIKTTFKLVKLA
tara:strand:+ start:22890 stop:23486 length:597 start_codon:yes stop_codon:yes gene_type:complete